MNRLLIIDLNNNYVLFQVFESDGNIRRKSVFNKLNNRNDDNNDYNEFYEFGIISEQEINL
jgi:hypothetical protein